MNQELLNMVIEADITMSNQYGTQWKSNKEELEVFAKLAAAAEREACAKVCEEYETNNGITATWLNIVAEAIRARGETK